MPFESYKPPALMKIAARIRNFRDLSSYSEGYMKKGMIYRSSSLIAHQGDSLVSNLKLLDINSIIDLRTEVEILRESYKDWFLHKLHLYWVHLDISMPDKILEENGKADLSFYKQFIWYILYFNKYELQRIFNILSSKDNYSTIIHCHEGRDRTGIISALILFLLNVPEENIIQDYLASDPHTKSSDIEYLITLIEAEGGIENYLAKIGVEKKIQTRIKKILRP
ncbi:MAG: tyrosine-protein phosphatase [Candidatus Heimdallarchaeaceae archaeon]